MQHATHIPQSQKRTRSPAVTAGAIVLCLASPIALAQNAAEPAGAAPAPMPEATGATTTFKISGFELTGEIPLSTPDTTRVLAGFIGPGATIETLQRATAALEAELKAKGYGLHRVALPPQEVGDKVTLNIVKFVIGKITVEGASRYSEANIRASVPELQEGDSPNFTNLAIQTAIANENPGKQIQVALKESEEADKIDARLQVKEADAWTLSTGLSNTGTEATGEDRFSLVAGHANLFDLDHQASLAYTTSLKRVRDVKQFGVNYRIPLYRLGGVVGLSYTNSDVVGSFGTFSSTGAGQTYGLNYQHHLAPEGGRRSYLSVGLDEKVFNAAVINGATAGQLDRSSRPISLGYTARVEADGAQWSYNAELLTNLSGGYGNDLVSYQSEDPRIDSDKWVAVRGAGSYMSAFGAGWIWSARGQFQHSNRALISGEQFGLGGATSVRGVADRAIAGDSGVFTSGEVTTPELMPGLRAIGFVDMGWITSKNTDLNPNKAANDRLGSLGLGLRYASGAVGMSLEWGQVFAGAMLLPAATAGTPQVGDKKLHINLSARF